METVRHIPITFKANGGNWQSILRGQNLYVHLPNVPQAYFSSLTLTMIMEVAEEQFHCDNLVLLITPDIPNRFHVIEALRVQCGFQVVYPEGISLPASMNYGGLICMLYRLRG